MGIQKMICSACGYDTAGLSLVDGAAICPECGHTGPPIPEPVEWHVPWWVVLAVVAAAVTNLFGFFGSLFLAWACLMADWSQGEAVRASVAPVLLALLCGLTLVALMLAAWPRVWVLRLILTVVYALIIGAAGVQAFLWAAGLQTGIPMSLVSLLTGHPIVSMVALNVRWVGRIARDRRARVRPHQSSLTSSDGTSGARS